VQGLGFFAYLESKKIRGQLLATSSPTIPQPRYLQTAFHRLSPLFVLPSAKCP